MTDDTVEAASGPAPAVFVLVSVAVWTAAPLAGFKLYATLLGEPETFRIEGAVIAGMAVAAVVSVGTLLAARRAVAKAWPLAGVAFPFYGAWVWGTLAGLWTATETGFSVATLPGIAAVGVLSVFVAAPVCIGLVPLGVLTLFWLGRAVRRGDSQAEPDVANDGSQISSRRQI